MKLFFVVLVCLFSFTKTQVFAATKDAPQPVIVGVIDGESKAVFEEKIMPILKTQLASCSLCEIRNFSLYNEQGQLLTDKIASQLQLAASQANLVFVGWNTKMSAEFEPVVEQLKKMTASGIMVVGEAGIAPKNLDSAPLSRTVLGQVPDLVIIGEVAEKERLLIHSYYGPEMLTAIKPPVKDHIGQGFGPVYFVSRLAVSWSKRTPTDWLSHFKSTKLKSRRIWPELDDFFR